MRRWFAIVAVILFAAACVRTLPIYNVENAEIFTVSGKEPNLEDVRKAIVQAIVAKTWQIEKSDPDQVQAVLYKGKKVARILIGFSTKEYSITYKDSSNLLYNDGAIHKRYNSWVKGLQVEINSNLAGL